VGVSVQYVFPADACLRQLPFFASTSACVAAEKLKFRHQKRIFQNEWPEEVD
jgi:hypothetical protein